MWYQESICPLRVKNQDYTIGTMLYFHMVPCWLGQKILHRYRLAKLNDGNLNFWANLCVTKIHIPNNQRVICFVTSLSLAHVTIESCVAQHLKVPKSTSMWDSTKSWPMWAQHMVDLCILCEPHNTIWYFLGDDNFERGHVQCKEVPFSDVLACFVWCD